MNGLSRAIGAGVPVKLAGATYLLFPLTLGVFGIIENLILSRRPTPLDAAAKMCERVKQPELQQHIYEQARKEMRRNHSLNKVRDDVLQEWLDSDEGFEVTAWLCLRREQPRTFETLEQTLEVLRRASEEEKKQLRQLRDQISGMHWFSMMDFPRSRKEGGIERDVVKQRVPTWHEWIRRVMDEFPGVALAEVREWTLDNAKGVLAPKKKKKRGRAADSGGSDGLDRQFRKRKVL